ncbi:hypothetical protein BCR43DRAFT_560581 [Syncephalastrum racemosum]|uniref:F-box domain-containing protein n=1 Tax=Syncephalastrum racemosum TaxID=13706 RepID=A0A1X2HKR4_SYNRA|nr:hypothetical protein BCR43DRAFT_560581 [Syncephalastrum racemosum]
MTDNNSLQRLVALLLKEINYVLHNNLLSTSSRPQRDRDLRDVGFLEEHASKELSRHNYLEALATGKALLSLGHNTQALCIIGDSLWGLHRVNKAILAYSAALKCKAQDDHTRLAASRIRAARTYARRRKDPLSCFPDEIMLDILSLLDTPSRVACTAVSHTWRAYATSPFTWKKLDVRLRSDYDIADIYIHNISRYVTPQLTHLTIYSDADIRAFMSLVEDKHCVALKSLELLRRNKDESREIRLPRNYFCERFFRSLELVGQSLVHLHIVLSVGTVSTHTLRLILDTCPALEHLECRSEAKRLDDRDGVHEPNLPLRRQAQHSRLKYLSWPAENYIYRDPDFFPSNLPNLETLVLSKSFVYSERQDFSRFVERLSDLNLKVLMIGQRVDKIPAQTYASDDTTEGGLRRLKLCRIPISDATLRRLLLQHQSTLQELVIMTWEPSMPGTSEPDANIQGWHFPGLRRVHISEHGTGIPATLRPLSNFLKACTSSLESITISQALFALSTTRALLNFPHLKHASLYELRDHPQQAMEPMVALARGLSRQKESCPLQALDLTIGLLFDEDYEKLFVAAGNIASLKKFKVVPGTLADRDPVLSIKAVTRFIRRAVRSGLVKNLTHIKFLMENGREEGAPHDHFELAKTNLVAAFPHIEEIDIVIA